MEILDTNYSPESTGFRALMRGDVQREIAEMIGVLNGRIAEVDKRQEELAGYTQAQLQAVLLETLAKPRDGEEAPKVERALGNIAGPSHHHMPLLQTASTARIPAWLHGEAGSGKSTAAEQIADRSNVEFRSISLCPTTTKSDLLGYRDANGQYRKTAFRQTYEEGGVFLFDEIDNAHPSSLAIINHALANKIAEFPDQKVEMHPDAIIVAAANTIGKGANAQYVGRAVIDAATLDRFVFIPWDIDEDMEEVIVTGVTDNSEGVIDIKEGGIPTPEEWLREIRGFRERIDDLGMRHLCSTRAAIFGTKLARLGMGRRWLRELCVYKGMNANDRTKLEQGANR